LGEVPPDAARRLVVAGVEEGIMRVVDADSDTAHTRFRLAEEYAKLQKEWGLTQVGLVGALYACDANNIFFHKPTELV
jgi:hypothetical protein